MTGSASAPSCLGIDVDVIPAVIIISEIHFLLQPQPHDTAVKCSKLIWKLSSPQQDCDPV